MSMLPAFRVLRVLLPMVGIVAPALAAPPAPPPLQTFSMRAALPPGDRSTTLHFILPCPFPQVWLLKQIQAAPAVGSGGSDMLPEDVLALPPWAVSAITYQAFHDTESGTGASVPMEVTLLASGPQHVSTSVDGGQDFTGVVRVRVIPAATSASIFTVHVTGQCGPKTILETPEE